jgi:hypothetical protein
MAEMLAEHRRIESERTELREEQTKAEIATESEQQAIQQRWDYECKRFFRDVRQSEGIDYNKSPVLFDALNAQVKQIASRDENADKSGEWILKEAHKAVSAEMRGAFGETQQEGQPGQTGQGKPNEKDAVRKAVAGRQQTGKLPTTLRHMPAADDAAAGEESQFDHIQQLFDRGDIVAGERELAKLSPEQQELYLQGG